MKSILVLNQALFLYSSLNMSDKKVYLVFNMYNLLLCHFLYSQGLVDRYSLVCSKNIYGYLQVNLAYYKKKPVIKSIYCFSSQVPHNVSLAELVFWQKKGFLFIGISGVKTPYVSDQFVAFSKNIGGFFIFFCVVLEYI